MSYDTFIKSLDDDDKSRVQEEVEVYELTLGWMFLNNTERAQVIKDAKEVGNEFNRQLVKEVAEDAKKYEGLFELSDKEEAEYQKAKEMAVSAAKKMGRKEFGASLAKGDSAIDTSQSIAKKLTNVPLIGKGAKKALSDMNTAEAGAKASRISHALGASPETSVKVGFGTSKAIKNVKDVASSAVDTGKKLASSAADTGETAAKAIKKFGAEHGGKAAAAAAAGLGALGLVKALRRKKAQASSEA